ncbi:MAG: DsbE family thiol:disulfide interchange protein [Gammaproteobacteria bacterium]|nr:DsbE family thiol:disulfide interchange protein [Gammaproteobacteria bacterium]
MSRRVLPFTVIIGVVILLAFFYRGLQLDPKKLPSALLDKPAPMFNLPQLHDASKTFGPAEMKGKVWLLNVWASWCAACRSEHPLFMQLSRSGDFPIYGLNYKDKPAAGQQWLRELGDPYKVSISDLEGDVGIDFGVYGVPETFLIDKEGVIRYKHVGPISRQDWRETIAPKMKELNEAKGQKG